MRIHHLNCGTHCPLGGALFDGRSRGLLADLCTHVVLIETAQGLVLVDTGYGLQDVLQKPRRRLAYTWPLILNTRLREEDTALRQIEALGFSARDVRHIILTHLDFDHAGGIEDFPEARVHVLEAERDAAEHKRRGFIARQRYRPLDWDAVRDWRTYAAGGEAWFGFEAVRALDGLPPEILMVPLAGHTHGHAGITIATEAGWLLHAGDAYLHRGQMDHAHPHMPVGLAVYERIMMTDLMAARGNLERLRALDREADDVRVFCSHDSGDLEALKGASR
ncbi:beta-lactamase [Devosia riboflavina]|uniref:Beta-lactamase n=1 Tax=Devosia riboflavina TaxID=46914 RepID=A0A087M2E1_9HYPH|nr:MBL fold metallo-hydrolase [Devosia riboflavina]KFL31044.1 beta-lactamase [Devosia riboflavina]